MSDTVTDNQNLTQQILDEKMNYFKTELLKNNAAKKYLEERGIGRGTIMKFDLGYAGRTSKTVEDPKKQEDLKRASLLSKRNYYKFQNRIMIPFIKQDEEGNKKILGFTSRVLGDPENSKTPKYLRTTMLDGYTDKDIGMLFLDESINEIEKAETVIIVEGVFDALALHECGYKNTVALMGTERLESCANDLKRHHEKIKNVVAVFDQDRAGEKSKLSLMTSFINNDIKSSLSFGHLPKGIKDAGELLEKRGKEMAVQDFLEIIHNSHSAINELRENFAAAKNIEDKANLCYKLEQGVKGKESPFVTDVSNLIENISGVKIEREIKKEQQLTKKKKSTVERIMEIEPARELTNVAKSNFNEPEHAR